MQIDFEKHGTQIGLPISKGITQPTRWMMISVLAATIMVTACGKGGSGTPDAGTGPTDPTTNVITDPVTLKKLDKEAFQKTLYDELRKPDYECYKCHKNKGEQSAPLFVSDDVDVAFEAASSLVTDRKDRANLGKSRILKRLIPIKPGISCTDQHCSDDIAAIKSAIIQWSEILYGKDTSPPRVTILSDNHYLSDRKTVSIADKRISNGLLALYLFRDMTNNEVQDLVEPKANLSLSGTWSTESDKATGKVVGLTTSNGKAVSNQNNKKFIDAIVGADSDNTGSMAYTVEVWIKPTSTNSGASATDVTAVPATIASYSYDSANRHFTLGQAKTEWAFRNNSNANTDAAGTPNLLTTGKVVKNREIQHLVATYDPQHGQKLYINGVDTEITDTRVDPNDTKPLATWKTADTSSTPFQLIFGNETTNVGQWRGTYYMAAIYGRALRADEIAANYAARYVDPMVLQFSIKEATGVDGYIEFVARTLDNSGYLFSQPSYVGNANGLRLKGIEIMVNGDAPTSGQVFRNIDTTLTAGGPQLLSTLGSVIAIDTSEQADIFTLSFEKIGTNSATPAISTVGSLPIRTDAREEKDIPKTGIRTFDQINDTMAQLTGVPLISLYNQNGNNNLGDLRQQLPATPNLMSFMTGQQVAITKLAGEYCNSLVNANNTTNRTSFFAPPSGTPAFNFGETNVCNAFNSDAKRNIITDALVNKFVGLDLANQPAANIKTEIAGQTDPATSVHTPGLLENLAACSGTPPQSANTALTTKAIVVAACTAVLSSAATMLH